MKWYYTREPQQFICFFAILYVLFDSDLIGEAHDMLW